MKPFIHQHPQWSVINSCTSKWLLQHESLCYYYFSLRMEDRGYSSQHVTKHNDETVHHYVNYVNKRAFETVTWPKALAFLSTTHIICARICFWSLKKWTFSLKSLDSHKRASYTMKKSSQFGGDFSLLFH